MIDAASLARCLAMTLLLGGAAAGCKKDAPAAAGKDAAAAKVVPADAAAAAVAPTAAATDRCDLVGMLEVRRVTPGKDCGEPGRYATLRLGLTAATPRGDALDLEIADADVEALGNVMAVVETTATATAGACAVTLTVSDAGRTDEDESFKYQLSIPAAGGAVTGTLAHSGAAPDGEACSATSAVEGTMTRGTAPAFSGPPLDGPHPSLEAYCARRSAAFDAADCSYGDETDLCSCAPASKDAVDGPLTARAGGGELRGAALLLTAASAVDYTYCEVALELAAGWYVLPAAFPCGAAPASHDDGIAATITRFEASGDGLTLAWIQQLTGGDLPGPPEALQLSCAVASGAAPTCTPASETP